MTYSLRDFSLHDTAAVNHIALEAFKEYKHAYSDWETFSKNISEMATLSDFGEIIVATADGLVVGAVVYIGPNKPKSPFFDKAWAIIRMLVVHPRARGQGIGRTLTEECIRRARRDNASCVALHTTPIMKVALPLYHRMGFEYHSEAPPIFGVPYGIYVKQLNNDKDASPSVS